MNINIYQLVWELNQASKYEYRMWCSVFSFAHNIYFNTWIWLEYNDIQEIAKLCKSKWMLDDAKWWTTKCFEIWFDYIKKKWFKPDFKLVQTTYWTKTYEELYKNHYMLRIWIKITKEWLKDIVDNWQIDTLDYNKIKWADFSHFLNCWNIDTNFRKWNFLIDNYFWKRVSIIWYNPKEISKIMMNTVYAVVPI